jgi:CubicO group peptidase (beta-lactamase class C family)
MSGWAAAVASVVERHVRDGVVPGGAWLLDDGDRVHAGATGTWDLDGALPATDDAVLRIASLTKPVVAALTLHLADDGVLDLDAPVERWLPELADQQVLRRPDGPLDDVVPAGRSITVLDLLTLRMGFGFDVVSHGPTPLWSAVSALDLGLGPPKPGSPLHPDDWLSRFASLPLMAHPGQEWLYDTGFVVLGVLLARAGRQPLEALLRERLLDPLGMTATGFAVRPDDLDRLPQAHADVEGALVLDDPGGAASAYARAPAFPAANGGLVSTLRDYLAFTRMLRAGGAHEGRRLLPEAAVRRMTSDQLTSEVRAASPAAAVFLGSSGWGLGVGVTPDGRFGWAGYGTSFSVDPATGRIVLLATQRMPPSIELITDVDAASSR